LKRPKILIADDSIVVRMILNRLLTTDLEVEVTMAANGELALEKAASQVPDLVILDVDMPRMDGMVTLKTLHSLYPLLPIIMLSALTEADAEITLRALSIGAADFLSKHGEFDGGDIPLTYLRKELIPKISALLASNYLKQSPQFESKNATMLPSQFNLSQKPKHPISILAIAVSTGGPVALEKLLSQFPSSLQIPIVIVQHIPAAFTAQLVEGLARKSVIKILQCQEGLELEKGCAYIATGGRHMEVIKKMGHYFLKMNDGPLENSCRPSADVLFRSVADAYGVEALALVLTGMGQDGMKGCEAIKVHGCPILAQDEATSVIWGMPGAVVKAGLADAVLPLEAIAPRIMSLLN
jgi:two-component system, chemotaxis family, protein-glutamate methylesterase/glutaminase